MRPCLVALLLMDACADAVSYGAPPPPLGRHGLFPLFLRKFMYDSCFTCNRAAYCFSFAIISRCSCISFSKLFIIRSLVKSITLLLLFSEEDRSRLFDRLLVLSMDETIPKVLSRLCDLDRSVVSVRNDSPCDRDTNISSLFIRSFLCRNSNIFPIR